MVNHAALSISGNCCFLPDLGGHSSSNRLLLISLVFTLLFMAQARTCLPLFCVIGVNGMYWLFLTGKPVSSSNSRSAASRGSSSSENSPLGIDQAPASLF